MRINYEKALSVVAHSNPTMASEVQTCIDLFEKYAGNTSIKNAVTDALHNVIISNAESVLADHFITYSEQTATI